MTRHTDQDYARADAQAMRSNGTPDDEAIRFLIALALCVNANDIPDPRLRRRPS